MIRVTKRLSCAMSTYLGVFSSRHAAITPHASSREREGNRRFLQDSDPSLQRSPGTKTHSFGGFDRDRLTGSWVAALACLPLDNLEGAEPTKPDLLVLLERQHDAVQDRVDRSLSSVPGTARTSLDHICQMVPVVYAGRRRPGLQGSRHATRLLAT